MVRLQLTFLALVASAMMVAAQKLSPYLLPAMPQKEMLHQGFVADPEQFGELKMDFPMTEGKFEPTWASIDRNYGDEPEWWRNAKFGIFIHWGPQASGMSGDWYARNIYREETDGYRNHLVNFGHPSEVGYKDVLHRWNPAGWDPEKLVKAYYDAGFRYALIVGVHHDNYDLWNSRYQPWNSVNVGPKKDFLAAWKKELQKKGMRFGVSFHHEYTWWWWQRAFTSDKTGPKAGVPYDAAVLTAADGKGKWWEGLDPVRLYGKPMSYENLSLEGNPYVLEDIAFGRKGIFGNDLEYARWYATQWAMRMEDVIDNYDPDFIYTDGNGPYPFSGMKSASGYKCDAAARVIAHYFNRAASLHDGKVDKLAIVKFSKACKGVGTTFEGSFPKGIKTDQTWMADRAVGDWFYRPGFVYDAGAVIRTLLEDVSRGGNLTLCVSLTPQGGMDEGSAAMLKEIGAWMRINGGGIYGSRAWKNFGEGDMVTDPKKPGAPGKLRGMPGGKLDRIHADFRFTTRDFRFTEGSDGAIYAWCMAVPKPGETVRIKSLGNNAGWVSRIVKVTVPGCDASIGWKQEGDALVVEVPKTLDLSHVVCFRIVVE